MKKLITHFVFLTLILSCQSQTRSIPLQNFEKELSEESINEFEQNSPLIEFQSLEANYNLYPYLKVFGNSGAVIIYEFNRETEKILNKKIKNLQRVENNSLEKQDSIHIFNSSSLKISFPEIDSGFEQLSGNPSPENSEVEIYLLKKGKLNRAFNVDTESNSQEYKFSIGIYLLRKQKKVLYWFLIYDEKNRH